MNLLIVTGERSAENYASLLVDELSKIDSSINFFSVCSDTLKDKTKQVANFKDISVIGAKEALSIANKAYKLLNNIKSNIIEYKIDMVILMDFPEFNMKIMKFAKKLGKKVVYYISPQLWAWRRYRINALFKYSDLIIPILPFEKTFFNVKKPNQHKIFYAGHPIVDILTKQTTQEEVREDIILIMPGSRKSEINYNSKTMFEAAKIINNNVNDFKFIWIVPKHIEMDFVKDKLKGYEFIQIEQDSYAFMKKSYFGILKSGTTTLEATLFNLPMVVSYRISKASYYIGKMLIKNIKYISLPNLIYGDEVVKELIEEKATAQAIANEFFRLHRNQSLYKEMQNKLKSVSFVLGEYPVTQKIAKKIYSIA